MIRRATVQDYPAILVMSREFWLETAYDDPHDDEHVLFMIKMADDHDLLFVVDIDHQVEGFVAGLNIPLLGNKSVTCVTELAYWINPAARGRHGLGLIRALEKGAKAVGAKYINMIAMESSKPEVAAAIYARRGYRKVETTYSKQLGA